MENKNRLSMNLSVYSNYLQMYPNTTFPLKKNSVKNKQMLPSLSPQTSKRRESWLRCQVRGWWCPWCGSGYGSFLHTALQRPNNTFMQLIQPIKHSHKQSMQTQFLVELLHLLCYLWGFVLAKWTLNLGLNLISWVQIRLKAF